MTLSVRKEPAMDVLFVAVAIVSGLAAFGLAALRWGVDSRPGVCDDHGR